MTLHQSPWVNGGAPMRCHHCKERFETYAYRGEDGRYYCSRFCCEWEKETQNEMKPH